MNVSDAMQQIAQREPVIDFSIIERFRQRRASLVNALVDAYLEEAPRYFQDLRKSVASGDFGGAKSAAHGLKSCSYNLGAVRLAKMCQETEITASTSNIDNLNLALGRIGPALFDTEEALKSIKLDLTGRTGR